MMAAGLESDDLADTQALSVGLWDNPMDMYDSHVLLRTYSG